MCFAKRLREKLGLAARLNLDAIELAQKLGPVEVDFSWPDVWSVLDQVGFAYQAFAKKYKHKLEKKALGLPRRIGPPVQGSFTPARPSKIGMLRRCTFTLPVKMASRAGRCASWLFHRHTSQTLRPAGNS